MPNTNLKSNSFTPLGMGMLLLSIPLCAAAYYLAGRFVFRSSLDPYEVLVFSSVLAAVVTGGYQLYFWVQRQNYLVPVRTLEIELDRKIPFKPRWVWIYSFLYYIMIGLVVVTIDTVDQGLRVVFGGLLLLLIQSVIFFFFPVKVPSSYRRYKVTGKSTRFLKFVQGLDNGRNCFPSMHCSLATYIGLVLMPLLGPWSLVFIALIALSCVLVKQHQVVDLLPGIALGALVYALTPGL